MGNCLYDKAYTQEVVKMKVPAVCVSHSKVIEEVHLENPNSFIGQI